jgi:hypothetical protein
MSNPFAVAQKYLERGTSDDPVLNADQWYPDFSDFHHKVIAETPDFDYAWVCQYRPELYRAIKVKENEIDALGPARLSQIMALLREWRELILTAEFERKQFTR